MASLMTFFQNNILISILFFIIGILTILLLVPIFRKNFKSVKLPGGIQLDMKDDVSTTKKKEDKDTQVSEADSKTLALKCGDVKRLLETCITDTINRCEKKTELLVNLKEKKDEIIENVLNNIKPKIKMTYNKRIGEEGHSQLIFFIFSKTIEYNFNNILLPSISRMLNEKHLESLSNDDLSNLYTDIIKMTETCLSKISAEYIESNASSLIDIDKIEQSLDEFSDTLKAYMKEAVTKAQECSITYQQKIDDLEKDFKDSLSKNIKDFVKEDIGGLEF